RRHPWAEGALIAGKRPGMHVFSRMSGYGIAIPFPMNATVETLHGLMATCRVGCLGFRSAAEEAGPPGLRAWLLQVAGERKRFGKRLELYAYQVGAPPPRGAGRCPGSVSGGVQAALAACEER